MPIVFVHGVATRRHPGYAKLEAARAALMRSFLVPATGQVSFFAPYWGGQAAAFAWEHASLPQGDEEVFGPGEETPAILLGEVWESEPPPDDRVVLQVARNSFADGIDLLFGTAAEDVDPDEANGFARLAVRAAKLTRPAWLDTARDDIEVINRLAEDLSEGTDEEEAFGPDRALLRVYEGLSRIRGAAGRMTGRLAVKALRPSLNRSASMFLGDILVYLRQRERLRADGPIATTIATDLRRAHEASTTDDPQVIVIAHSMGGNIVYDLLSGLRPDLSCDVLVTVGSQVGVFAELGLFDAVRAPVNPATDRIPKPPGVGRWINVFDLNDILGFATERIFDGVRDLRYSTGKGAFAAHSTYFVRPSFYNRLATSAGRGLMTQMFFEADRPGPAMHALVIGVGGYALLPGGGGRTIADPLRYGNLGQLTSPPRSALEFASWLRDSDPIRWAAPLASIDLRISPAPADPDPGGSGVGYPDAGIDSITEAYNAWKERCATDANNVAVFYFCGHGLQSEEQLLLASDFGRYEGNHFRGAFAFDSTRTGFLQRPPRTQCFFIDACRETVPGVTAPLGGATADPLDRPDATRRRHCDHDLTLQSSTPFATARSRPKNVSYFTAALINALKGGAAVTDEFGDWVVRTDRIAMVIDSLVEAEAGRPMPTAKGPAFLPAVLYRPGGPPDVELTLACVPEPALCRATLFYVPEHSGRTERKPPVPEKWKVTVKAGYYRIGAEFEDHTYDPVSRTELINPPTTAQTLRAVSR